MLNYMYLPTEPPLPRKGKEVIMAKECYSRDLGWNINFLKCGGGVGGQSSPSFLTPSFPVILIESDGGG